MASERNNSIQHSPSVYSLTELVDPHKNQPTWPTSLLSSYTHEHPLNLKFHDCVCDICGDHVEGLIYECPICKFNVHPNCTQLPPSASLPIHEHSLWLQPALRSECKYCNSVCTLWRYRCVNCDFNLHLKCASALRNSPSPLSGTPGFRPPPHDADVYENPSTTTGGPAAYEHPPTFGPYNMSHNVNQTEGGGSSKWQKFKKMLKRFLEKLATVFLANEAVNCFN